MRKSNWKEEQKNRRKWKIKYKRIQNNLKKQEEKKEDLEKKASTEIYLPPINSFIK